MKIIHYKDAEGVKYPGDEAKGTVGRVLIGKADGAANFCMRSFELPPGAKSGRHAHHWEHQVFVHSGEGEILHEGKWSRLGTGSVVFIPGGEEHQLRNAGQSPFVFVCVIPSGVPEI
ncbi:MAG TPA: cupin domain-containing protein [Thermodesulfobacteriota bacterium]|nr:cupin domain-containing protein [Thermodesulfobacteriota bacterium]